MVQSSATAIGFPMFGLSLSKIILTALVVWLAWMVAKRMGVIARRGAARPTPADRARQAAENMTQRHTAPPQPANEPPTLELLECPSCGNFIAPGTTCSCGYKHPG